jgi:hypothetical protein
MIKLILSDFRRLMRRHRHVLRKGALLLLCFSVLLVLFSAWVSTTIVDEFVGYDSLAPAREDYVVDRELDGVLYFNDRPSTRVISDRVKALVGGAQESVQMAMYSIDMYSVRNKLEEARDRGVSVDIVLDASKHKQHSAVFADNKVLSYKELGAGVVNEGVVGEYMHHKFLLVDVEGTAPHLLTGTMNYTTSQEWYDPSFVFETADLDVIEAFKNEYDLLLKEQRGYKKFRDASYQPLQKVVQYQNGFLEIWFGPGFKQNSVRARLIDLIDSAENTIDIIVWQMTDREIVKALRRKAQEGVKVTVLADDDYLWSEESTVRSLMREDEIGSDVEVVSDLYRTLNLRGDVMIPGNLYFNPYLHQHTLIVDNEVVLSGTNNWTFNGFFKNDENIFVSNVDFWVQGFRDSFQYHYEELRGKRLEFALEEGLLRLIDEVASVGDRLVLYNETSGVEERPAVCFSAVIEKREQGFLIPDRCNTPQTVVFVLDSEDRVVAGEYL